MKALLIKDTYVIWRQTKYLLLIILLFSAMPSGFNNAFAVVYAAMMPYTALAYDERSKWDQLSAMMPYSLRDLVLSKYVFGWLWIGVVMLLSCGVQIVRGLLTGQSPALMGVALAVLGACCVLAVSLPAMFRLGVEKGRLAMFLLIALICCGAQAIASLSQNLAGAAPSLSASVLFILLAAAAGLTALSVPLSIRFYRKRMS